MTEMTKDFKNRTLGSTGLEVGRLGLAASYGAPAPAFEESFEKGCNYFYLGSGRKRAGLKTAVTHLIRQGYRDKMVIAIQTYARFGIMTEFFYKQTLKSLGIDHADILILGWHNRAPSSRLIEFARQMKEKGLCRFIGMSGHNRSLFPRMAQQKIFDVFHVRYNAAHRGAAFECFPKCHTPPATGIVTYTATRWGHLLKPKYMPDGENPLLASDCYRYVMSNESVDVCLCGPKDIHQMRAALRSLELGPLDPDAQKRIEKIGDYVHAHAGGFFE